MLVRFTLPLLILFLTLAPCAAEEPPEKDEASKLHKEIAQLRDELALAKAQLKQATQTALVARREADELRKIAELARNEALQERDRAIVAQQEARQQRLAAEQQRAEAIKQAEASRMAEAAAREQAEIAKRAASQALEQARANAKASGTVERTDGKGNRRKQRGKNRAGEIEAIKEQLSELQADVQQIRERLTSDKTGRGASR